MAIDWLELQRTARREFDTRLAHITDWSAPTPDTEWTVADLVRHVVDEQRWVAPILEGRTLADAEATLEPIRDDLAAEWHRYAEEATAAWASTPLDAPVHLSYGTVPCLHYLEQQVGDITVHTWTWHAPWVAATISIQDWSKPCGPTCNLSVTCSHRADCSDHPCRSPTTLPCRTG